MRTVGLAILTLLFLMGAGELAADQTADKPVPAAAEFRKSCAACHGADGKGDGPMAILLTVEPPDLTVLAERNGGIFPFDYVMRLIDGRSAIGPHGTREMPIWGDRYMLDLPAEFRRDPYRTRTAELVRARILEVTYYIQSIQH